MATSESLARSPDLDSTLKGGACPLAMHGETPQVNGKWIDVARQIASELAERHATPGEVLNVESEFMARYGVSRSTLREALRLLQYLGLVEIRMGRTGGIVLREPTAEHFAQILTLYLQSSGCTWRQLLEAYALFKPLIVDAAARNRTDEQAAELESMLTRFDQVSVDQQAQMIPALVKTYHAMSGNPMFNLIGRAFETVVLSHSAVARTSTQDLPKVVETTRLLAQEIASGNAERAVKIAMRQGKAVLEIREKRQPELLDSVISWE